MLPDGRIVAVKESKVASLGEIEPFMNKMILLLVSVWSVINTLAVAPSLSNPGCQETCGGITIPYPFGIGNRSCYYNEWFEIDCKTSSANATQSTPFLKKLNLQVLNIKLPPREQMLDKYFTGLIFVKSSIISSNCSGSSNASTGPAMDLRGSTFVFSQLMSSFAAVGRNTRVLMKNIEPNIIGCMPSTGNCSDVIMDCCETTIPSDLKDFNVDFESIGDVERESEACGFAFIVESGWFNDFHKRSTELLRYNSSDALSFLQSQDIPAVLEWTLPKTVENAAEQFSRRQCIYYPIDDATGPLGLYCYCAEGFEGNAYLLSGCTDINECEDVNLHTCPDVCVNTYGSYKCRYSRWKQIVMVLGSILVLLFLISGAWSLYKIIKKRQMIKMKKKFFKRNGGLLLKQQLSSCDGRAENKLFTSKEIAKATDNFNENRILGQGGQGTVYKGMLSDGRIVAVKKSKIEDQGEIETFINEVVILSQIIHRNIVKLLGCCLETEVPLLVYEFIPNGTLSQYLHCSEITVSWEMRLRIAIEVAGALSYLHSAASIPIYHRDIKSANILLDDKYRAKIADFGTSRLIAVDQTHLTTLVHGTFGYLDPEYFQSSQFSDKSDVYSFGVVLVELLTGQKAISSSRIEQGIGLATYFITEMEENRLLGIVDTLVVKQGKENDIVAIANLAKRCLNWNGRNRPTMREVHMELERIMLLQKVLDGEGKKEEVESLRSQEIELSDALSTSSPNIPGFDCFEASSVDEQPLVFNQTW